MCRVHRGKGAEDPFPACPSLFPYLIAGKKRLNAFYRGFVMRHKVVKGFCKKGLEGEQRAKVKARVGLVTN